MDVFKGTVSDQCSSNMRPSEYKPCTCEEMTCSKEPSSHCPVDAEWIGIHNSDNDYEDVGCFKKAPDDEGALSATDLHDPADTRCMNYAGTELCQSGVPFYRIHSDLMTPAMCFTFCVSKGLDISALVDGSECRCGATVVNVNIWHRVRAPHHLAFEPARLTQTPRDGECEVRVWRYKGHYENGGIPDGLTDILAQDVSYEDSIVAGRSIPEEQEEDGEQSGGSSSTLERELRQSRKVFQKPGKQGKGRKRSRGQVNLRACWPHNCGPGGGTWPKGPWPTRFSSPPASYVKKWKQYVAIRYKFHSEERWRFNRRTNKWYQDGMKEVDKGRKEAFRQAVKVWRDNTCIYLLEDSAVGKNVPHITVGNYNPKSCYATE